MSIKRKILSAAGAVALTISALWMGSEFDEAHENKTQGAASKSSAQWWKEAAEERCTNPYCYAMTSIEAERRGIESQIYDVRAAKSYENAQKGLGATALSGAFLLGVIGFKREEEKAGTLPNLPPSSLDGPA
ncbi:MAG: hypothetical protein OXT65_08085 [Alphaproteobacteria bacterium]|nr:hypothetical protein [Alphaproteobacteria bacterium]